MGDVAYVRTTRTGSADLAGAVVDIISQSPVKLAPEPVVIGTYAWKHGYNFCTWKKRYFRLEDGALKYFKKEKASTPKGIINLSCYSICKRCEAGDDRATNAVSYIKLVNGFPQTEKIQRKHGLYISCPEQERTYYIHFENNPERDAWHEAINCNIELVRQREGMIEDMVSKVSALADAGLIAREKLGIVKMALRGRYTPRLDFSSPDPFIKALTAVALSELDHLKDLLEMDATLVQRKSESGITLLIKACTTGNVDIAALLLHAGADVNAARHDGDTPLITAARLNHVALVRLLLEHEANKEATNKYGETALTEGKHSNGHVLTLLNRSKPIPSPSSSSQNPANPSSLSSHLSSFPSSSSLSMFSSPPDVLGPSHIVLPSSPSKLSLLSSTPSSFLVEEDVPPQRRLSQMSENQLKHIISLQEHALQEARLALARLEIEKKDNPESAHVSESLFLNPDEVRRREEVVSSDLEDNESEDPYD